MPTLDYLLCYLFFHLVFVHEVLSHDMPNKFCSIGYFVKKKILLGVILSSTMPTVMVDHLNLISGYVDSRLSSKET